MSILILSRNVAIYSTRRLSEAFRARGAQVTIADPASVGLAIGARPALALDGGARSLPKPAVVVPRIGAVATDHALAVLRAIEADEIPLTATADGVRAARDKGETLQRLAAAGLPIPRTVFVRQAEDVPWAVDAVGGPPVVLKRRTGTHGVGVMLAESVDSARAILESMWEADLSFIVQEFVEGAAGRDLRILVVEDRLTLAIRRIAPPGSFRSNLHSGGRAEGCVPPNDAVDLALAAAEEIELPVAGVDLLESEDGFLLCEVNASPGLEGIEDATGVDVAADIADLALDLATRGTE